MGTRIGHSGSRPSTSFFASRGTVRTQSAFDRPAASHEKKVIRPLPAESLRRVVIEAVTPEIDGGRFPIKRCPGDTVHVQATIHADSHDVLAAVLQYRATRDSDWLEVPMQLTNAGEDLWEGY